MKHAPLLVVLVASALAVWMGFDLGYTSGEDGAVARLCRWELVSSADAMDYHHARQIGRDLTPLSSPVHEDGAFAPGRGWDRFGGGRHWAPVGFVALALVCLLWSRHGTSRSSR